MRSRPNSIDRLCREAEDHLRDGDAAAGMNGLHVGLRQLRSMMNDGEWQIRIKQPMRTHAIRELLHQSPFTSRAFEKPRGYAGDAVLLDYAYGVTPLPPETSALGGRVYRWEFESRGCRNVRSRCRLLARKVDEIASQVESPRILSVACGHLREAQYSRAVKEGRVGEYIALDQDPESLALVYREQAQFGIRTVQGSVRGILAGRVRFSCLDFVYAAGLYDYLADSTAARLTARLFSMLRPGGTLLVANYTPDLPDTAYMDAVMDWPLVYRDEAGIEALSAGLPSGTRHLAYRGEEGHLAYLEAWA